MFDQETINMFVNQLVFTLDSLFMEKNIKQELMDYLYLIAAGMIINYGTTYINDIYNSIANASYEENLEEIIKVSKKKGIKDIGKNKEEGVAFTLFDIKQNGYRGLVPKFNIDYTVCILNKDASEFELLNYLAHELNHIFCSRKKTFFLERYCVMLRNGLSKFKVIGSGDYYEFGRHLNEAINTLQTEDIIREILKLNEYEIENEKFRNALNKFKDIDYNDFKVVGYESFVSVFRPLYEHDSVKILFNKNIVDGTITNISQEFNRVLGDNAYENAANKLEVAAKIMLGPKSANNYYNEVAVMYLDSISKDFVQAYIEKKFSFRHRV